MSCPNCGYCPHCRRSAPAYPYPYWSVIPPYPYTQQPTWTVPVTPTWATTTNNTSY